MRSRETRSRVLRMLPRTAALIVACLLFLTAVYALSGVESGLFGAGTILLAIGVLTLIILLPAAVSRQLGGVKWRWAKWKNLLFPGVCLAVGTALLVLTPSLTHLNKVRSAQSAIPGLLLEGNRMSAATITISPSGPVRGIQGSISGDFEHQRAQRIVLRTDRGIQSSISGDFEGVELVKSYEGSMSEDYLQVKSMKGDKGFMSSDYYKVKLMKRDIDQETQFISARIALMQDLAANMCTAYPQHASNVLKAYGRCGQELVDVASAGKLGLGVGIRTPGLWKEDGLIHPGNYYVYIEDEQEVNWRLLGECLNHAVAGFVSKCSKEAKDL